MKRSVSRDFRPSFFYDSNPSRSLINRLKYFRIRFWFPQDIWSQISKNLNPQCASHRRIKILDLANQKKFLHIFSFILDVFTPKMISPDCFFKSNERLTKISILILQCAVWLRGVHPIGGLWLHSGKHTAELFENFWSLDSTVCSLTPRYASHWGAWHSGEMHTTESDSLVCITPLSQTISKISVFCVFVFIASFNYVLSKNFWR